jgi:NAD-dependent SIR2 family protein deacetylase
VAAVTDPRQAAEEMAKWLTKETPWFALTGAGVSTDSGIPAYRDATGAWQHSQPMTYQTFMGSEGARQRYWARSLQGYGFMQRAEPNAVHVALQKLQTADIVSSVITQNVDSLHERAGTRGTVALHGRLAEVVCTSCRSLFTRAAFQEDLLRSNPGAPLPALVRAPDGDAVLEGDFSGFQVPACSSCGGILKPNVVFFGEGVPRAVSEAANTAFENSRGVLVLGSSLVVFSGFRFVRAAHQSGKPIVILNRGRTRADALASLKIDADCGDVLSRTLELLKC